MAKVRGAHEAIPVSTMLARAWGVSQVTTVQKS